MADNSQIEWTDATWNVINGCTLVSEGCRNCYAAQLAATRLKNLPSRKGLARRNADGVAKFTGEVRLDENVLTQPLHWRKPRRIFVCAHGDLFHENVPDAWIDRVFAVMALSPQHTFQVLTKRPERMRAYFAARRDGDPWAEAADYLADLLGQENHPAVLEPRDMPLPNVWFGTSVEDQATADARIPHLLNTPAAIRFVSAEPLLGPVDLKHVTLSGGEVPVDALCGRYPRSGLDYIGDWDVDGRCPTGWPPLKLDWIIVGGESGANARPMHPDWARSIRDQCAAAGTAFHFKQWGSHRPVCDHREPELTAKNIRMTRDESGQLYAIVVKKAAGRLLDGVEHNGFPEAGL